MLIPIRHENMSARRWPVITLALIVLNTVAFVLTTSKIHDEGSALGQVKLRVLMLAATHPELKMSAAVQQFVTTFRDHNPEAWTRLQHPDAELSQFADDGSAFKTQVLDDVNPWQARMDSLAGQYTDLASSSIIENYAFVPAHPKPLSYLTANFLHGGWLHLIGNMWFLWLAGFVLEDAWGRPLYSAVYLIAGAVALQIHGFVNAGSLVPTLGASGAVAALMGAFLVRFPKMRIEMMWLFSFRAWRFKAPAYTLLPLWLLMEVFYGSLFGGASGVAHWAHVGGFVFGAVAAVALSYTGLEQKANKAIEEQVGWQADPEIQQASDLMDKGQFDEAAMLLSSYLATHPDSLDACNLLPQAYFRKGDLPKYLDALTKLCAMHLKARQPEAAWQDYEDFLRSGGTSMPATTWLELCRVPESQQDLDRALAEYDKLAAAYPKERPGIMAQLGAGRICLKLSRPQDALRYFEAAAASSVPHLDLEPNILSGIREAKAGLRPGTAAVAQA